MKSRNTSTILKIFVFLVFVLFARVERSYGQCVGDIVLPDPKANLPVFALQDFAGQAMGVFNEGINPISIPVIGSLLPPIESGIIGGFIPEMNFVPGAQVNDFLGNLEQLLSSVSICDIVGMRALKPTDADMDEFWTSSEVKDRLDHLQTQYDTFSADPNFGLNAQALIPNKGGASVATVIANYVKTQLDVAWDLLLINQFRKPVSMVWVDPEIQCMPKIGIPFFGGCATIPVCLPAGSSYNHVENVYNVHRAGHHALVPDVLVTPMMNLIMALERATSNWLPFVAVVMNKEDIHGYWGSRNPQNVNTLANALFMTVQDPITQKALQQNIILQDRSGLLFPFAGDTFTTTTLPSVLSSGSIPGFGTLPIPPFIPPQKSSLLLGLLGLDSQFPVWPFVRTQYDEYKPGSIHSDDINPIKYFQLRSMGPSLLNTDGNRYKEVIDNFHWLHSNLLNVAQSQELGVDSIWEYSRLYKNAGGGLMKDAIAPNGSKQEAWLNPLSANNCVSFRGRAMFPEPTFANSTARLFCEIDQAIHAEQRECMLGRGHCPGPRTSYWPYKLSPEVWGCSSEYSDIPDPETECRYDEFQLHNTAARGYYNGSELPENYYPKDEDELQERDSGLASHLHRQRDCMDVNVGRLLIPQLCGWERCPSPRTGDLSHFEPPANCVATSRYDPSIRVPREGCL
jgi:hypothetical protein